MKVYFNYGASSKWKEGDEVIKPVLGYNWWHWFPRIGWNGGRPWRREVIDLNFRWLRFWVGMTIYGRSLANVAYAIKVAEDKEL